MPINEMFFTTEDTDEGGGKLETGNSAVSIKTMFFTAEDAEGRGGRLKFGGEGAVPVKGLKCRFCRIYRAENPGDRLSVISNQFAG